MCSYAFLSHASICPVIGRMSAGLIFLISTGWYVCAFDETAGMTIAIHEMMKSFKLDFQNELFIQVFIGG